MDEYQEQFQAAMRIMSGAFVEACQRVPDWELQGELQHSFFDAYQEAKRIFATVVLIHEVTRPD